MAAFREVQVGKFSVLLASGGVISAGRFLWRAKRSQIWAAIDASLPTLAMLIPPDAAVSRGVVRLQRLIGLVLGIGGDAQVVSPVVNLAPIDVVRLLAMRRAQDNAVHQDTGHSRAIDLATTTCRISLLGETPAILKDALSVRAVNEHNLDAIREEDEGDTIFAHRVLLTLGATPGMVTAIARHLCDSINFSMVAPYSEVR